MTRFINITLLVCLAAIFYVQKINQDPTTRSVSAVQSAPKKDAPQKMMTAEGMRPAAAKNVAAAEPDVVQLDAGQPDAGQSQAAHPEPVPEHQKRVLVVMSPKPETSPKPQVSAIVTSEPQELDPAEIQARFAAAALAETSKLDFEEPQTEPPTVFAIVQPTAQPTAQPSVQPLVQKQPKVWRVTGRLVNARAAPRTDSAILDKLVRGAIVQDTGETDGLWSRVIVQDSGALVWIHRNFLTDQS